MSPSQPSPVQLALDAEVHRLLAQILTYEPSASDDPNPAATTKALWSELQLAWWRASVAALPPDSVVDTITGSASGSGQGSLILPNWPVWITSNIRPSTIDAILH